MRTWIFSACLLGFFASISAAADTTPSGNDFFEKKVRPVLVANCYQCHSASAKELQGKLRLDTKDGIRKGGESGPALVPGKPNESLLIKAIRHEDGMDMPPKKMLPDYAIADLVKWVEMGAPDPRVGNSSTVGSKINKIDARKHWSFQPVKVIPPTNKDKVWSRTEIDRYIVDGLNSKNLRPVPDADRRTLIRRVYLDLIGIPPKPEEVEAFVADQSANAFEKVVDHLLSLPQYGERWGRHWLDVARYGESTGKERNISYPYAWRYRDYVYDSFNADKPYDLFIREQIAGDLMPAKNDAERNEHLTATGFLAIGPKGLNEKNREQFAMDVADEQIDVSTRAVMGLSVACARCHDHKFDPIPTTDYYALAGIFRSTEVLAGVKPGNNKTGYDGSYVSLVDLSKKSTADGDDRRELARLHVELRQAETALAKVRDVIADAKKGDEKGKGKGKGALKGVRAENARETALVAELKGKIETLEKKVVPPGAQVMGVQDAGRLMNCKVNIRGEVKDLGPEVKRGYVSVLTVPQSPDINMNQSGRLQLAVWLTNKTNPLTARVMANRIWYHLFGSGIVSTVDNFGALSEPPTHPELLDYLANRFTAQEWSVKKLIREIVLSRTYQLSSQHNENAYGLDPDNHYLWRMSRRRLDAEAIRDSMLFVSGKLDLQRPAGSITQELNGEVGRKAKTDGLKKEVPFRSAYLPLVRGMVPEFLNIFDVADPELIVGQRDVTTVATQALYMMNSPFVHDQAAEMSRKVVASGSTDEARLDHAFRLAFSRPAGAKEQEVSLKFLNEYEKSLDGSKPSPNRRQEAWTQLCHSLLASGEFRYTY
jgi:mono/diheme cytochrome c family protein